MISFKGTFMRVDSGFISTDTITSVKRAINGDTVITYRTSKDETGQYFIDTVSPDDAVERINRAIQKGEILDLTV